MWYCSVTGAVAVCVCVKELISWCCGCVCLCGGIDLVLCVSVSVWRNWSPAGAAHCASLHPWSCLFVPWKDWLRWHGRHWSLWGLLFTHCLLTYLLTYMLISSPCCSCVFIVHFYAFTSVSRSVHGQWTVADQLLLLLLRIVCHLWHGHLWVVCCCEMISEWLLVCYTEHTVY